MSDRDADLLAIRAGLSPMPDTPARRRARLLRRLVLVCSALGRAVAVFALCFAAANLALRQAHAPVPAPSSVSPSAAPTGMTDSCVRESFRP